MFNGNGPTAYLVSMYSSTRYKPMSIGIISHFATLRNSRNRLSQTLSIRIAALTLESSTHNLLALRAHWSSLSQLREKLVEYAIAQ